MDTDTHRGKDRRRRGSSVSQGESLEQILTHLDLGLAASRTVGQYISVVQANRPVVLC